MSEHFILPIALAVIAVAGVGLAALWWHWERQRIAALTAVAERLGLSFSEGRNYELARRHQDLAGLRDGENRYAFDVISGAHRGRNLIAFDFHYETHSTDSKGHRHTSHHYRHAALLDLERDFPQLRIAPEDFLSKIAQAFGYDDIDFESHEFSRRFCVRSGDRKYAYDFCNARMIELLLDHPHLRLETGGAVLAAVFDDRMDPGKVESQLDLLCDIRKLMPDYLFASA